MRWQRFCFCLNTFMVGFCVGAIAAHLVYGNPVPAGLFLGLLLANVWSAYWTYRRAKVERMRA